MGLYKTIYSDVEVEVSLDEWEDDELIEELENRDYTVSPKEGHNEFEEMKDDIFTLYKEWLGDQGDRDNRFEKAMRAFFEKHLNKVSV